MVRFKDTEQRRCSVRRQWWPFGDYTFVGDTIGFLISLIELVLWPFWLAARFLGAPWTLVSRRSGDEPRREKVVGWEGSKQRIAEIVAEMQRPPDEPESRAIVY